MTFRISRPYYWGLAAVLLVISAATGYLIPNYVGIGELVAWSLLFIGRLHDINKGAQWYFGALAIASALVTAAVLLTPGAYAHYVNGESLSVDSAQRSLFMVIMGIALLLQLVFIVWLGLKKGDPGPNRFGAAPPGGARKRKTF